MFISCLFSKNNKPADDPNEKTKDLEVVKTESDGASWAAPLTDLDAAITYAENSLERPNNNDVRAVNSEEQPPVITEHIVEEVEPRPATPEPEPVIIPEEPEIIPEEPVTPEPTIPEEPAISEVRLYYEMTSYECLIAYLCSFMKI